MVSKVGIELKNVPLESIVFSACIMLLTTIIGFYLAIDGLFPDQGMYTLSNVFSILALLFLYLASFVNLAYVISTTRKRR